MSGIEAAVLRHQYPRGGARSLDLLLIERGQGVLPRLGDVPKLLRDDPKLGSLCAYPFAFRVEPIGETAGVGVLELLLPVPADDAVVKLAIEDTGTDDAIAPDGGVVPALAGRAGDAVAVQVGGDALRPLAGDILAPSK